MFIELINYQGALVTVNVSQIVSIRKHTPSQTAVKLAGTDIAEYYRHSYEDVISALETATGKDVQCV